MSITSEAHTQSDAIIALHFYLIFNLHLYENYVPNIIFKNIFVKFTGSRHCETNRNIEIASLSVHILGKFSLVLHTEINYKMAVQC